MAKSRNPNEYMAALFTGFANEMFITEGAINSCVLFSPDKEIPCRFKATKTSRMDNVFLREIPHLMPTRTVEAAFLIPGYVSLLDLVEIRALHADPDLDSFDTGLFSTLLANARASAENFAKAHKNDLPQLVKLFPWYTDKELANFTRKQLADLVQKVDLFFYTIRDVFPEFLPDLACEARQVYLGIRLSLSEKQDARFDMTVRRESGGTIDLVARTDGLYTIPRKVYMSDANVDYLLTENEKRYTTPFANPKCPAYRFLP